VSDTFVHYSFNAADIDTGENRLTPNKLALGQGMKRVGVPDDREMRAGFTRFGPGQGSQTFFWYKEIWYVIHGTARLIVLDKRTSEETTVALRPGDFCYFPAGVRIDMRVDDQTDFHWLYCAVPASNRDSQWLAVMDERDISDVRRRGDFKFRG
jgi:mannose-6-phosphate isomerase-like protein (cupin superfamily)